MLVIGLFLFVVPRLTGLPAPVLHGAVLLLLFLQQPINSITGMMPHLSRGNVALAQIEALGLKLAPETSLAKALPAAAPERSRSFEQIELVGLTHTYRRERDEEKFPLGPISTSLKPGELVFLIGGNGSGKTTLAKLLLGLYEPERGRDPLRRRADRPRRTSTATAQHFSAVFFDFFLFEHLPGLGLGAELLDGEARRYLRAAAARQKVEVDRRAALDHRPVAGPAQAPGAAHPPTWRTGRSTCSTSGRRTRTPMFKEVFYRACCRSSRRAARRCS